MVGMDACVAEEATESATHGFCLSSRRGQASCSLLRSRRLAVVPPTGTVGLPRVGEASRWRLSVFHGGLSGRGWASWAVPPARGAP